MALEDISYTERGNSLQVQGKKKIFQYESIYKKGPLLIRLKAQKEENQKTKYFNKPNIF